MQLARAALLATAVAAAGASRGGSNGVQLTAGSVGANFMSFAFLGDGTPAFKDLPGSVYKHVPAHLAAMPVSTEDRFTTPGFVASWDCPSALGGPCDAYVFLYECPPCVTQKGGLPGTLNSQGWERSRCAPQFTTGSGSGQTHKMTAYKKQVASGTVEEVTLVAPVEFVSFGLKPTSVDCSDLQTQAACEDASLQGECQWNLGASKCQLAKCVGFGPNPLGCSSQCVTDDL